MKIRRPGLAWGLLWVGGIATLGLPWLQVRANRVVEGVDRYLWSDDWGVGLVLVTLGLVPWLVRLAGARGQTVARVTWGACVLLPIALMGGAGWAALPLAPQGSFARVSPSWAFWLALLGAWGLLVIVGPKTGWSRGARALGGALFPLACLGGWAGGLFSGLSLSKEYEAQAGVFWADVGTHLELSGAAVAVGTLLGGLLGGLAHAGGRFRSPVFFLLNVVQTIPSLALFGLLIVPMAALGLGGIGPAPALVALGLYATFPVARATLTGLDHLDRAVLDAGRGLGMNRVQILVRVQIPLALPVVLEGLRTASVQAVGNTVVAALIGAGGLGSLIFLGLGQVAPDLILLGTLPVVVLALLVDQAWAGVLGLLHRRVRA